MTTIDALYRQIGRQVVLNFAAKGGKVTKKKTCKKGWECGYTCLPKTKQNCGSPIEGQAATYTDWLSKQAAKATSGDEAKAPKKPKAPKASKPAPKVEPKAEEKPIEQPKLKAEPKAEPKAEEKPIKEVSKKGSLVIPKDQDIQAFEPGENFKKAREFNPNAIKDLTPDRFNEWQYAKERLERQDDPGNTWNKSFEQFQKSVDPPFNKKSDYKNELLQALRNGVYIEEERFASAGIKLNKTQKKDLEANKAAMDEDRSFDERIRKAIEYPVVSDNEAKGFKPNMTTEEAMDYVKDSFFSGLSFYHGNPKSVVDSMQNDGGDPEKNNRGIFGKGVYLASSFETAKFYAATGDVDGAQAKGEPAGVIASAVKMKNPFIVDSGAYSRIIENFPGDQMNCVDSEAVSNYFKAKGHDGVYLKDLGYMVVLDTKQMVTHSRTDYTRQEIQQWSDSNNKLKTSDLDIINDAQKSITGKALSDLKGEE